MKIKSGTVNVFRKLNSIQWLSFFNNKQKVIYLIFNKTYFLFLFLLTVYNNRYTDFDYYDCFTFSLEYSKFLSRTEERK